MRALTQIKLMGEFELRIGDGEPVALPSKVQALAAYLVLQGGGGVNRNRSAKCSGQTEARIRHGTVCVRRCSSCAGTVSAARIPSGREATRSRSRRKVRFVMSLELRALIMADSNASWQAIMALYRGPLLDGFPPTSPEFDDYLNTTRRALETDVLEALARIADDTADGSDPEQCIAIAQRMLAIDPLREDTHRRLIAGYAFLDVAPMPSASMMTRKRCCFGKWMSHRQRKRTP